MVGDGCGSVGHSVKNAGQVNMISDPSDGKYLISVSTLHP